MKQEEKELLLKDICARLPYYVWVEYKSKYYVILGIGCERLTLLPSKVSSITYDEYPLVEEVKPCLFPLSSMTEEQFEDILDIVIPVSKSFINTTADAVIEDYKVDRYVDFCNKNHLDWRGLIPRGLAIDATNLGIYE